MGGFSSNTLGLPALILGYRPLPRCLTEVLSDFGWNIKATWESLFDLSNLVLIHQDLVWNSLMTFPCSPDAQPNVSQNLGQAPGEGSIGLIKELNLLCIHIEPQVRNNMKL